MRLKSKIALITGAASGIGKATALLFAKEGAKVAIADLNSTEGLQVKEEIENNGGSALFYKVDVSQEENVKNWVLSVIEQWREIDILVNNAAAFVFGKIEDITSEDWDRILSINVKGYANCAKYAIPSMRKKGGGAIVNMGSISSFVGQPAFVPYNTSKGAITQMTRCLAYDLAIDNIRVNSVCPGTIETPASLSHAQSLGLTKEQFIEEVKTQQFIPRIGQPIEVAYAVLFLGSDEASYITGTCLMVDGGYTAR